MNNDLILKMIKPYLVNNTITYKKFDSLFSMLSMKEQYAVVDFIAKQGIYFTDEEPEQEEASDDSQEQVIELDNDAFVDDYDDSYEDGQDYRQPLFVRKNIRMDNQTIIRLVQEGNEQAKQDLCIKNKGLVDKCVCKYEKWAGNKLDFEDLEQVGMIGMLTAAERFDFSMGTEFSTYAVTWIRQAITREICDRGFTIRVPVHKMEQIFKVCRFDSRFLEISDRNERVKKISIATGYTTENVEECLMLYYAFLRSTSLDLPVGEEEETTIVDLIPVEGEPSIEDTVALSMMRSDLEEEINTLREREQKVLRLRYGFYDGSPRTLEEVGREFGLTRERIRQIEASALRKLRHPSRSKKLQSYYYD